MDKNKIRQPTAEEEYRQDVDEVTDMITTEDVVEQAVYMANAPDCCADEHAASATWATTAAPALHLPVTPPPVRRS